MCGHIGCLFGDMSTQTQGILVIIVPHHDFFKEDCVRQLAQQAQGLLLIFCEFRFQIGGPTDQVWALSWIAKGAECKQRFDRWAG